MLFFVSVPYCASEVIIASDNQIFKLPNLDRKHLFHTCAIGARTWDFDISAKQSKLHPFVLVDVEPVK
jgi:hypothetical protein